LDLEWLAAVWVPVGRDGTRVLGVGRDGARTQEVGRVEARSLGVGRDGARVLGVERDGARTRGVGQDRTRDLGRDGVRGLRVARDLLIRLEPSGGVSVDANLLALGIPNNDTRQLDTSGTLYSVLYIAISLK